MRLKIVICLLILAIFCTGCNARSPQGDTQGATETNTETKVGATDVSTQKPTDTQKPTEAVDDENKGDNKTDWKEDGKLKILSIGNSFSDDTMQYVYQIAKDLGVEEIKLGNLYIGGCSLDRHTTNAKEDKSAYDYRVNIGDGWKTTSNYKMSDAIRSEDWDFISLQQASGSSGVPGTYSNLEYMIKYVKSLCSGATLVWNMTWAYQQDSEHAEFSKYENSQLKMYEKIISTVRSEVVTKDGIKMVVPNGTAIQNARTSYVGDNLTRDGFHLSLDLGRYIAGLTFVGRLTGLDVSAVTYAPAGVDEEEKKVAVESAKNALADPFDFSFSEYEEKPGAGA